MTPVAIIIADLAAAGWRVIQLRNGRWRIELIAAPGQVHSRGISWADVVAHWRGQCCRQWRQLPLALTDVRESGETQAMNFK